MAASSVDTAVDAFHKNIMRAMEKFILKDYICHKSKHSWISTLHSQKEKAYKK
jgi:hypothetical protein